MKKYQIILFVLVIACFFSCKRKKAIKEANSNIEKLQQEISNNQSKNIEKTITKLLENKKTLENYISQGSPLVNFAEQPDGEVVYTINEVNNALTKLLSIKDKYIIVRRTEEKNSIKKRRCSVNLLAERSTISIGRYRMQAKILYDKQRSVIPIFFHILEHSDGRGKIINLENTLQVQIDSLNEHFSPANISFILEGSKIYKGDSNDMQNHYNEYFLKALGEDVKEVRYDMQDLLLNELSISPERILNVYSLYSGDDGINIGQARYPFDNTTLNTKLDAVLIGHETLPNQPLRESIFYDGSTLTHEIGHYLGLLHSFEMHEECWKKSGEPRCWRNNYNGCDKYCEVNGEKFYNGDFITDTPPQKTCFFDQECCNTICISKCNNQDTILTSNFMGYNEDACINTFTDEQYIHMNENIFDYRNHYIQDYF